MKAELFPFQKRALSDLRMKTGKQLADIKGRTLIRLFHLQHRPERERLLLWRL